MSDEETFWIELQNQKYESIKIDFNFKSLIGDLFMVFMERKSITQSLELNAFKCIKTKLETFLENSKEYQLLQNTQQDFLKNRNVILATVFLAMSFDCQDTAAKQIKFFQKQISGKGFVNYVTSLIQPKQRLTMKFIHENIQPFFASEEEERLYDMMVQTMKKVEMFDYSDYQIFIIAMLFHCDYEDSAPQLTCYRNFLLNILQKKQREKYPQFDAIRTYLEFVDMMKTFSHFECNIRVFSALR